jgi:hypothetical protein
LTGNEATGGFVELEVDEFDQAFLSRSWSEAFCVSARADLNVSNAWL